MKTLTLQKGIVFKIKDTNGWYRVFRIREKENKMDVILPSGSLDEGWDLQQMIWQFEKGECIVKDGNISWLALSWAIKCHEQTNHMYGFLPYKYHLYGCLDAAEGFLGLVPEKLDHDIIRAAVAAHDVIEDTRQSYNDVKDKLGEQIADLVYACTTEKGKTRKERNGKAYYSGIRNTKYAAFVKLCDRISNCVFSRFSDSHMLKKYRSEYAEFIEGISGNDVETDWFREMQWFLEVVLFWTEDQISLDDKAACFMNGAKGQFEHYLRNYANETATPNKTER